MKKKDEILQVRFNLENDQDRVKWDHIKKKKNRQSYIKDLILIDLVFDLFNNPGVLREDKEKDKTNES